VKRGYELRSLARIQNESINVYRVFMSLVGYYV